MYSIEPFSLVTLDLCVKILLKITVKLLDWGEEGHRSDAEIASLRAAFTQEVAVWHKLDHPNVTKVRTLHSLFYTGEQPKSN